MNGVRELKARTPIVIVLIMIFSNNLTLGYKRFKEEDTTNCGLDAPVNDINRTDTSLIWLHSRLDSHVEFMFKKDISDDKVHKKQICFRFDANRSIKNTYAYLLEEPDIFEDEERIHRIINEIEDRINAAYIKYHRDFNQKNRFWNLNSKYTTFNQRHFTAYEYYILTQVGYLADLYQLFHYFMPSVANRTDTICEFVVHGLDVMIHTVDSMAQFMTFSFVHGVIIKGCKLILKVYYEPLAIGGAIAYAVFKSIDAIFIQRREKQNTYPDPKKHCQYMNLSYVDQWMAWLKQADVINETIGDASNKV